MVCDADLPVKRAVSSSSDSWPMRGPLGGLPRNFSPVTAPIVVGIGPKTCTVDPFVLQELEGAIVPGLPGA